MVTHMLKSLKHITNISLAGILIWQGLFAPAQPELLATMQAISPAQATSTRQITSTTQARPISQALPTKQTVSAKRANQTVTPHMLLPEGYKINGLSAKLILSKKQNRWFLIFTPLSIFTDNPNASGISNQTRTNTPTHNNRLPSQVSKHLQTNLTTNPLCNPIEVLPGKWLTAMTYVVNNKTDTSITFRVWGEITTYHHRNFILPTLVATESLFNKKPHKTHSSTGLSALNTNFNTSTQINHTLPPQKNNSQIPERLRQILLNMPNTKILKTTPTKNNKSKTAYIPTPNINTNTNANTIGNKNVNNVPDQSSQGKKVNWKDGYVIVDRVGRLAFSNDGSADTFIFESVSPGFSEPPVVLQPSSLLELMEKKASQFTREIKFRISGVISRYKGTYYLLLRKVLIVHNPQNLGK